MRGFGQRIVLIGAGSAIFTPRVLGDFSQCPELYGSTIVLMDVDGRKAELIGRFASKLMEYVDADYHFEVTTDLGEALTDAEFVVVSISMERLRRWDIDQELGNKYGIYQVQGENGGPGGLSLTLRNVPMIMEICREMERLCPDAYLLNFTNPESRICAAIDRYTSIKAVGLCHGVAWSIGEIEKVMGLGQGSLDARIAGLNHFSWLLDLRYHGTGEDAYDDFRRVISSPEGRDFFPLSSELCRLLRLFPLAGDTHVIEYLPLYPKSTWEKYHLRQLRPTRDRTGRYDGIWKEVQAMTDGAVPPEKYARVSGEEAVNIIRAMVRNENSWQLSVNIRNEGGVSNLPDEAIVEIPGVVSRAGVRGVSVGPLPPAIASMCRRQVAITGLAAKAAVEGDRQAALEALLIDPYIPTVDVALSLLDDILSAHADVLPQF